MDVEGIRANYRRKRCELEEAEDILQAAHREGEHLVQEALSDINRSVQQSAVNNEPFDWARQSIMKLENDYYDEILRAKNHVYKQQEELELEYRNNLRKADKV